MGLINIAKIAKAAHWQCPVSLYACLATIADKAIKTVHERGITPIPNFGRVEFCQKSVFVFVFLWKERVAGINPLFGWEPNFLKRSVPREFEMETHLASNRTENLN